MRSSGKWGTTWSSPPFLNVVTPPSPKQNEPYPATFSASARPPVKQWKTPRKAVPAYSSSTAKVSSKASRTWRTTGRSRSSAHPIWAWNAAIWCSRVCRPRKRSMPISPTAMQGWASSASRMGAQWASQSASTWQGWRPIMGRHRSGWACVRASRASTLSASMLGRSKRSTPASKACRSTASRSASNADT